LKVEDMNKEVFFRLALPCPILRHRWIMGYEREEEKALVVKGADFVIREAREWAGEKTKKACLVLHPETFPLLAAVRGAGGWDGDDVGGDGDGGCDVSECADVSAPHMVAVAVAGVEVS
jgi:hypothetical protein